MTGSRRLIVLAGIAGLALGLAPFASADLASETALAQRYAPVVRLVHQAEECGHGEPYIPTDVNVLFNEPTVALRGPWNRTDLVKVGPAATDLVGRFEYHLDFPGDPLNAGCSYEKWARRLTTGTSPTAYSHVATEPGYPGKLSLQYWFFYPFNDFNNTHEGDWEMIQLVFDAPDAAAALERPPTEVGYSSHDGAERAAWGDDKLELVGGTHPVVYPASGSHANKFGDALYLGSSAEAGVGCDDTRGPHDELRPVVRTIPSDPAAANAAYPWIAFEGRWGELQAAFFNGPPGPNMQGPWTRPIERAQGWRDTSYAVPTAGAFGTGATDLFCSGVAKGSKALVLVLRNPPMMLLILALVLSAIVFAIVRATWLPVAPLRLARRRSWGQILSASARMYTKRPRLFLGIGLLLLPIAVVITALQWLVLRGVDLLGTFSGQGAGAFALLALVIGITFTLFGLSLVQAATACALVELDAGRPIGPLQRLSDRARQGAAAGQVDRALRRRLGGTQRDGVPDSGRHLARGPLVPACPRRRARGHVRARRAPAQRTSRPPALDQGGVARRCQRGDCPHRRAAPWHPAHLYDQHAARAPQRGRGDRLRVVAAVRRARHRICLLRHPRPRRAGAAATCDAARGDRAPGLGAPSWSRLVVASAVLNTTLW